MPKRIQLPDDFYQHDFKQLAKVEKNPRTRVRLIGLSHIQNGKSYEQVAQYLLQSLSAVKQWVRHYKDDGIDGLKEKQRSGRPSKAHTQNHTRLLKSILAMQDNKKGGRVRLKDIQNMLSKDFNIHYQDISGVHYLVTKLGLSGISSRSKDPKQDKEVQAHTKKLQTKGNRCPVCGHRFN
ncbi:MAG: transposase [Methylococcales symbiont of Iophon sp. n. MRB-2018]|nr:MAG: transposase [Methylococcales symbiont of Iophon sp. n. MRB-2018]KAF3980020.1 MAG: transposase [Methylococcales symbiont of Iophon sp. n. MRB-2018]